MRSFTAVDRWRPRARVLAWTAVTAFLLPGAVHGQNAQTQGCNRCHGELELLRQYTDDLGAARALLASAESVAASAHEGMWCRDCHINYRTYPHGVGAEETRTCGACHEENAAVWRESVHASVMEGDPAGATCADCHTIHEVAPASELVPDHPEGEAMDGRCEGCHESRVLPSADPHTQGANCASCHDPHATRAVSDPESRVSPRRQETTCGACHDEKAAAWRQDIHGQAVFGEIPESSGATRDEESAHGSSHGPSPTRPRRPPSCTACHGGHGIAGVEEERLAGNSSAVCESCHQDYAASFLDSYHGQATTLGSRAAADCAACHTGHQVYPTHDPRSSVSEENLLATCQSCHPRANTSFAQFAPHVDHHDRERFPAVYWTYRLMTGLLIGVFAVFGVHTLLWLIRLTLSGHSDGPDSDNGRTHA